MIVIYFYDDIRKNFRFSQYTDNTYNINNVNIRPGPDVSDRDDFDTPMDHLGKDAREEMRWRYDHSNRLQQNAGRTG